MRQHEAACSSMRQQRRGCGGSQRSAGQATRKPLSAGEAPHPPGGRAVKRKIAKTPRRFDKSFSAQWTHRPLIGGRCEKTGAGRAGPPDGAPYFFLSLVAGSTPPRAFSFAGGRKLRLRETRCSGITAILSIPQQVSADGNTRRTGTRTSRL